MKKIIAFALCAAMLLTLAACGKKPEEITPPETEAAPAPEATTVPTEPAPTEPAWEPAYVRAGDMGVLYKLFQRGDKVTVLGEIKEYFVVEGEDADLLVEMRFLRPEGEEAPAEKDGWARTGTEVFTTGYRRGEPIATLGWNTRVKVLDAKGDWMLIEWSNGTGYVDAAKISPWKLTSSSGGSGGGGGSVNNDGTDVSVGGLSAANMEDYKAVTLGAYNGPVYEKYDTPKEGVILSKDTEGYLHLMVRGDEAKVTEVGEETCSVYVNGFIGTVPRWAVRMEGDEEYESWTGYTKYMSAAYAEYQKFNELQKFNRNQEVLVVDELEEVELYVVELDGVFGYVEMANIRTSRWVTSGGGGSGSGSSGGSGSTGWTPPVM